MGTSPKEQAASEQRDTMNQYGFDLIQGSLSGQNQFDKVNPYLQQAKTDISSSAKSTRDLLNRVLSTRMVGIGKSAGESLVGTGMPKGADMMQTFAGAFAPAMAQNQQELANVGEWEGGSLADISKFQGSTLADLIKSMTGMGLTATGQGGAAINNMKDSTEAGDILGGLTMGVKDIASLMNPELGISSLLSSLLGGGGKSVGDVGSGNGMPGVEQSLGIGMNDLFSILNSGKR